MAEERIDGAVVEGGQLAPYGSTPGGTGDVVDGSVVEGGQLNPYGSTPGGTGDTIDGSNVLNVVYNQIYTMRAWSASLSKYVVWTSAILDSSASQYTGAGTPLTDIVLLKTR